MPFVFAQHSTRHSLIACCYSQAGTRQSSKSHCVACASLSVVGLDTAFPLLACASCYEQRGTTVAAQDLLHSDSYHSPGCVFQRFSTPRLHAAKVHTLSMPHSQPLITTTSPTATAVIDNLCKPHRQPHSTTARNTATAARHDVSKLRSQPCSQLHSGNSSSSSPAGFQAGRCLPPASSASHSQRPPASAFEYAKTLNSALNPQQNPDPTGTAAALLKALVCTTPACHHRCCRQN